MAGLQPKTLYIGNLDTSVSEGILITLFGQMGAMKSCKIIRERGNVCPYAFIEFLTYEAAAASLIAMNKRCFLGKEMKVNWANQPKIKVSSHHHIFVGDLSPEVDTQTLREAFAPFGEISSCRIIRDSHTMKSKGYGFLAFVKKEQAEHAIRAMNGQLIGSRPIRTNWSVRKLGSPCEHTLNSDSGIYRPSYNEIYNQTGPFNTTVYCGRFPSNTITDELILQKFMQFGTIQDLRTFKDGGYAFITFQTKESAARAIEQTYNTDINGIKVKCYWGKEGAGFDGAGMSWRTSNPLNTIDNTITNMASIENTATAGATALLEPQLMNNTATSRHLFQ